MITTYEIGDRAFSYKSEIEKKIRDILYGSPTFTPIAGSDESFLAGLLQRHHHRDDKIGCGVKCHQVVPTRGGRRFDIVRLDGSRVDWSPFKVVGYLNKKSERVETEQRRDAVIKALRYAVKQQTDECWARFAEQHPTATRDKYHVDHVAPMTFGKLAERFLSTHWISYRKVPVVDHDAIVELADAKLTHDWQTFHAKESQLRVIPADLNVKLGGRKINWEFLEVIAYLGGSCS